MNVFEKQPYRIYRQTFLQNVLVYLNYSKQPEYFNSESFKSNYNRYFESVFGVEPSKDFVRKGYGLESNDNLLSFIFTTGFAAVRVGVRNYRSFDESVMPQVHRLKRFIDEVLLIDELDSASIRKINIFPMKMKDNSLDINTLMSDVFSDKLLNADNAQNDEFDIAMNISKKSVWTEEKKTAIVRTMGERNENGDIRIILDTEIKMNDKLKLPESANKLSEINRELFDFFHWCVSPKVIKIME